VSRSSYTADEKQRITDFIDAAVSTLNEIDVLKTGLADTKKALAEELDIPAKVLNKAIAAAIKANLDDVKDDLDQVELVLQAAGRA